MARKYGEPVEAPLQPLAKEAWKEEQEKWLAHLKQTDTRCVEWGVYQWIRSLLVFVFFFCSSKGWMKSKHGGSQKLGGSSNLDHRFSQLLGLFGCFSRASSWLSLSWIRN